MTDLLVPVSCPVCGADEADPVAVGSDFTLRTGCERYLAVRCAGCRLVYLNPQPSQDAGYPPRGPAAPATVGRLLRRCGPLPEGARVLVVGVAETSGLQAIRRRLPSGCVLEVVDGRDWSRRPAGEYQAVLLPDVLEQLADPVAALSELRGAVGDSGALVIRTPNADAAVARVFGGRHWAGYDFPRHPCLYGPEALRRLAAVTGWRVGSVTSSPDGRVWRDSTANVLADWRHASGLAALLPAAARAVGAARDLAHPAPERGRPWLEAVLRPTGDDR